MQNETKQKINSKHLFFDTMVSFFCIASLLTLLLEKKLNFSAFYWVTPFKPFFIVLSVFILFLIWYPKIYHTKQYERRCKNDEEKVTFSSNKWFAILSFLTFLTVTLPLLIKTYKQLTSELSL